MPNNAIILNPSLFAQGTFQEVAVSNLLTPRLQSTINRWEVWYINYILSVSTTPAKPISVAALFISDCQANYPNPPTNPLNLALYNTMAFQTGRKLWQSKGMVDILMNLIFYHYITDKVANDSQSGIVSAEVDAAKKLNFKGAYRFAESRYNDALQSIDTLNRYLRVGNGGPLVPGNGGSIDYPQYIEPLKLRAAYSSIVG